MELMDWMKSNRWNMSTLSRELNISRPTMRRVLDKETDMTLRVAMAIVKFTNNQVTYDDLARKNEINEKRDDERKKNKHPCTTDTAI